MRVLLVTLTAVCLASTASPAQDYTGTYTTTNATGGTVMLTLAQDAQGQVTGTLSSGGVRYTVEAMVEEGSVLGTVTDGNMGLYFSAEVDGAELYVTLFEPDVNNQPNYATGQTIVFARAADQAAAPAVAAPDRPPAPAAPVAAGEAASLPTALAIAFGLPRVVAVNVYLSRSLVVEAVYQATALSGGAQVGRIVNTGTLALGYGGAFQYSPQPMDRLVVNLAPQHVHEFVIQQAQGNAQAATAAAWVMSPHMLRYVHRLPGQAEATIAAQFDGSRFEVQVEGWYLQSGTRYNLSLRASGQTAGTRDYHGQDVQTQYDLTGTIRGGGLEVDVNERHTSALVAATNLRLLPSQRGSASQFQGTINNVLRAGGEEYRFQNVQVETGQRTRGAGEGEAGLTGLQGIVLRNGAPFGRLMAQADRAMLQTDSDVIALDLGR
jgi:hypothetical protein